MDNSGNHWKDRLGITASALCAVHCAATPFLLIFLPTLQFTEWMASPLFHQIAAFVCVLLVAISIIPAYMRHRDLRVLSLSATGLTLILAAAFLLPDYCCGGAHRADSHASVVANTSLTVVSTKACTHENCTHSHADVAESSPTDSNGSLAGEGLLMAGGSGEFWAIVQPWMTPVGGFLLILAHAFNIRRSWGSCSSGCGCSKKEFSSADELVTPQVA